MFGVIWAVMALGMYAVTAITCYNNKKKDKNGND